MSSNRIALLAAGLASFSVSTAAADDLTFKYIAANDAAKLVTSDPAKKLYDIASTDAFRMALQIRNASSRAEKHSGWDEEIVIQEGNVLLNYGGTAANASETAPGEFRGNAITGGSSVLLHPGDIVVIPANSWHQMAIQTPVVRDILFRTKK